jgi:hypothetical protein
MDEQQLIRQINEAQTDFAAIEHDLNLHESAVPLRRLLVSIPCALIRRGGGVRLPAREVRATARHVCWFPTDRGYEYGNWGPSSI